VELHAASSKIAIDPHLLKCGVHGALTFDLHERRLHLDGSDGAEADKVFDQAGEGG